MSRHRGLWLKGNLSLKAGYPFFEAACPLVGEMAPAPVLGSGLPWADLCVCCMAVKQSESQLIADLSEKKPPTPNILLSAAVLGTPLLAMPVPGRAGGVLGRLELDFLQESNPVSCSVPHNVL